MTIRGFDKRSAMVRGVAWLCCVLLMSGNAVLVAQAPATQAPAAQTPAPATTAKAPALQGAAGTPETATKLTGDQLESLVAPIALYPDPLLSQSLVASTYPLELVQAQQWLAKNSTLKGDALTAAVEKQPWDPSVQATVVVPDLLKRLTEDITWTHNLGNAFLEQQADVMDAVQRLRAKAKAAGKLDTTEQQKVETKVVETKTVIEIQPTSTQVVYVPTYSPTVIWGPPLYYPYPPIYYPPYPPGAAWIGFGVGVAVGIGISGGWGYGCGWGGGGNNVYINHNNNFVRNNNINTGNINRGNSNWQHNPSHRGGAPYSNTATANRYGGSTRGSASAARSGGTGATATSRASGGAGGAGASRPSGGGSATSAGGDRVGSRSVPQTSTRSGSSAFGGASGGSSGASRAAGSSSRGASSMGSRGGGGGGRRR